ncbi:hypothetical protein BDN70DRAFT_917280 [Pholiota conissans]|uniref:MYND-type domain-containing protein n=1 Tax=Pholiota conissans TaxID=109636 RepID=A0A9P6CZE1_9AGAR|nr:hypothetical protein BDN70DRAFT_917280 [Pholiota conissans]
MAGSRREIKRRIEIAGSVTMMHPEWETAADASGVPWSNQTAKDIKEKRRGAHRICTACQGTETEDNFYKVCSRCKNRFYCSRECQTRDWPEHKEICHATTRQKRFEKLVTSLLANVDLMAYLKIAVVLSLKLLDAIPISEPWSLLVRLGIEPENILDFARLRGDIDPVGTSEPLESKKMKGMLQINAICPCTPDFLDKETKIAIAQPKRTAADAVGFNWESPVGVMVFVLGDSRTVLQVPILIATPFMDIARERPPFTRTITVTKTSSTVPMTASSCIEYVNAIIRQDKPNRCLLRAEMSAADKKIIRNSGVVSEPLQEVTRTAIGYLKGRMLHECVYSACGNKE